MADLEEVAALLHVHEKAHAAGHTNIAGAALNRLRQINAEHPDFGPPHIPSPERSEPIELVESERPEDPESTNIHDEEETE